MKKEIECELPVTTWASLPGVDKLGKIKKSWIVIENTKALSKLLKAKIETAKGGIKSDFEKLYKLAKMEDVKRIKIKGNAFLDKMTIKEKVLI